MENVCEISSLFLGLYTLIVKTIHNSIMIMEYKCIIKNQKNGFERVGKPQSDLAYPQVCSLFDTCVIIRLRQSLTIQKIPLIKMLTWISDS